MFSLEDCSEIQKIFKQKSERKNMTNLEGITIGGDSSKKYLAERITESQKEKRRCAKNMIVSAGISALAGIGFYLLKEKVPLNMDFIEKGFGYNQIIQLVELGLLLVTGASGIYSESMRKKIKKADNIFKESVQEYLNYYR